MICERCKQPIEVGQLYHQVQRHTDSQSASSADWPNSGDLYRVVHDYPCPPPMPVYEPIPDADLRMDVFTPGGVRVIHLPTGIQAVVRDDEEPLPLAAKAKAVEQIQQHLAAQPPECCGGGPQWGHQWGCPKCPD